MAPATGESHWYVGNGVSKPLFERLLTLFAQEAGAGQPPKASTAIKKSSPLATPMPPHG